MGYLTKVYVDSSYTPSGDCQAGVVYHCPDLNKETGISSPIFTASNSNTAEILGVYFAVKTLYEKYGILQYKVFNDSVVACSMLNSGKFITDSTLKKYSVLKDVIEYFVVNGIKLEMEKLPRRHKMMKRCDKLSKVWRKEVK